jgi:hypothetical protein
MEVDPGSSVKGPSAEVRFLEKLIVVGAMDEAGRASTVRLSVRLPVAPLVIDAPAAGSARRGPTVLVAGRTSRGGSVVVAGQALDVRADGTFEGTVALAPSAALAVTARAPGMAARRLDVALRHP